MAPNQGRSPHIFGVEESFTFFRCMESFHFSFKKEESFGQQDIATADIMVSLLSRNFSRRCFPTGVSMSAARECEASLSRSFPYLASARYRILLVDRKDLVFLHILLLLR